jgi:hypothetical protein
MGPVTLILRGAALLSAGEFVLWSNQGYSAPGVMVLADALVILSFLGGEPPRTRGG